MEQREQTQEDLANRRPMPTDGPAPDDGREPILGIDLGTTNTVAAVLRDGRPWVIRDESGEALLPSVVGLDAEGGLLVGHPARNQLLLAPERTVKSIKRLMGEETSVSLGDRSFSPQEISSLILATIKRRAERALGRPVRRAVITVPAFFNETQRDATRLAGELAGLEVLRIINEPTAAALAYEGRSPNRERILVYDLGGGTFDVSIVQIEQGVVEVLASHGDTRLGGDDFDQLLLDQVAEDFLQEQQVDPRATPRGRHRLLQSVEEAKKRLSAEAATEIAEEFLAERDGQPLHLRRELDRLDYEELVESLLVRSLESVDAALDRAGLTSGQIDRVLLVGGMTRTPLVHRLLREQLGHEPHGEVDPDMIVAMGAAIQGALIDGQEVDSVLVDITPHTLGIGVLGDQHGVPTPHCYSPIIRRSTPLPAIRSEIYYTSHPGQTRVDIEVFQGESPDTRRNHAVGVLKLEGLDEQADEGSPVLVRFELDLDGILRVTAQERSTGLRKQATLQNALTQFRARDQEEVRARLAELLPPGPGELDEPSGDDAAGAGASQDELSRAGLAEPLASELAQTVAKATKLLDSAPAEDAAEMRELLAGIQQAQQAGDTGRLSELAEQLDDIVFYLEDA